MEVHMAKKSKETKSAEAILHEMEHDLRKVVGRTARLLGERILHTGEDMGDVADGLQQLANIIRTNPGGT